jgi:hypothetical protein
MRMVATWSETFTANMAEPTRWIEWDRSPPAAGDHHNAK